jgi:hypothetical protein
MASFPPDRFDEFDDHLSRVGAHRAPKSKVGAWLTLMWAALATIALVTAGIIGLSVIQGGLVLDNLPGVNNPTPDPTDAVAEPRAPYPAFSPETELRVLNATPLVDLQTQVRDALRAVGWNVVTTSTASETTFEYTTVYYSEAQYEGVARGVAEALGGVLVAQSDAFPGLPVTVALGADYQAVS